MAVHVGLARARAVPYGPLAYRRALRTGGPALALIVPVVAVGVALVLWRLAPDSGTAKLVAGGAGWTLAALGMPTAILVGIPFRGGTGRYLAAAVSSALVWALLGVIAARRATRSPVASWRDWWREYLWLVGGLWLGVVAGLAVLSVLLLRS
jgi:hypothetical protein